MTVLQSNIDYLWNVVVNPRLGVAPYTFGGSFSPSDPRVGSDCSGATGTELSALVYGPGGTDWNRGNNGSFSTFTFAGAMPGETGPFGGAPVTAPLVCIAQPTDAPPDAVMIIAVNQQGAADEAHMICRVQGVDIEMGGNEFTPAGVELDYHTSRTNPNCNSVMDTSSFNQWFYLPGPIVNDVPPPRPVNTLFYPDVSNNNWGSVDQLTAFLSQLHAEGFAGVCHKVSQGAGYQDPYWRACRDWCEHNDLSWLGYHYVSTEGPAAQANNFNANYGGGNVMLDVEQGSGDMNNFWAVVNAFNNAGVNVSLAYLPQWYWGQIGYPDLTTLNPNGIRLVSSNYPDVGGGAASDIYSRAGNAGWASYGGCSPGAWQFTDKATIAGIQVDCNVHHTPETDLDGFFTGQGI